VKPDSPSPREVLLVGSVGLKDSEEVFRTVGPLLGARMKRIPDGETGPRTSWVSRLRFVLEGNPAFEDDPQEVAAGGRITHPTEGTRTWKGSGVIARGAPPPPRLRLKPGVRPELGFIGYPAGWRHQERKAARARLQHGAPLKAHTRDTDGRGDGGARLRHGRSPGRVRRLAPRETVARLSHAVSAAVKSPEVVERMAGIGMEPAGTTPEQYEQLLREEYERFGSLIRRIGMRLD